MSAAGMQLFSIYGRVGLQGAEGVASGLSMLEQRASAFARSLTAITPGSIGVLFGSAGLGAIIAESVTLFGRLEATQIRLQAILKGTGGAAGFAASELRRLAEQEAAGGLFTREEVLRALEALARGGEVRNQQLIEGLQKARSLTVLMHTDLDSAADALNRVLENPERANFLFRQAGLPQLSPAEEARIRALRAQGPAGAEAAQEIVMRHVPDVAGGLGQGLQGEFRKLQNSFKELFTDLGEVISPLVHRAAEILQSLADQIRAIGFETIRTRLEMYGAITGLDKLGDVLAFLVGQIKNASDGFESLIEHLKHIRTAGGLDWQAFRVFFPGVAWFLGKHDEIQMNAARRRIAGEGVDQAFVREFEKRFPKPEDRFAAATKELAGLQQWVDFHQRILAHMAPGQPAQQLHHLQVLAGIQERRRGLVQIAEEAIARRQAIGVPRQDFARPPHFVSLEQSWQAVATTAMAQMSETRENTQELKELNKQIFAMRLQLELANRKAGPAVQNLAVMALGMGAF